MGVIDPPHAFVDGCFIGLHEYDVTQRQAINDLVAHAKVKSLWDRSNPLHTDQLAARFLTARQWDVEASANQLSENLEWRQKNKVDRLKVWPAVLPVVGYDDIEKTNETTEERSDVMKHGSRMYSSTIYKWDKAGRPVIFERMGKVKPKHVLKKMSVDDAILWHLHVMELRNDILKHLSKKFGYPIQTWVVIQDMTGVSLTGCFGDGGLNLIKACMHIDKEYYPESLGKLYIINAPKVFANIWSALKSHLDPRTVSKIEILDTNYQAKLLSIIPPENLPVELGGSCSDRELKKVGESDDGADMVSVKIGRGESHENGAHAKAGETMTWEFTCNKEEITFSVEFMPSDGSASVVVVKPTKENAVTDAVTGAFTAPKEGDFIFKWDNAGNMLQRKVYYVLEVMAIDTDPVESLETLTASLRD